MSTERTRELHSPTAELVPPLDSSLPALWGEQWGMVGQTSAQPALWAGSCRAGGGLPASELQHCSLQHTPRRRCHTLPGPGSDRAQISNSSVFTVPKSFSYPKAAAPPNENFSIAYSSQNLGEWVVASRPMSSGFTCQVYSQVVWQISSARWMGETASMNLQTQKRCHDCHCSADTLHIIQCFCHHRRLIAREQSINI